MKLKVGDIVRAHPDHILGDAQQRAEAKRNLRMGIIIDEGVMPFDPSAVWSHVYWPRLETTRWSPTVTLALEEN